MDCQYIEKCGGCTLGTLSYEDQLNIKTDEQKDRFKQFNIKNFDIIKSNKSAFRNRAEFRIWKTFYKDGSLKLNYAMNDIDKNILLIENCDIVSNNIATLMPQLINVLEKDEILNFKLFSCEFLSSTIGDMLVTLIYHKKLDDSWKEKAKKLEKKYNIKIIGRSKKQKVVLSEDFISEKLTINNKIYNFQYQEGGFTQPNQNVNIKMIQWVLDNITNNTDDLCELYCGGGNFTIPLSTKFSKVLATEISKTSIKSAKKNCQLNNINNIKFLRMSSEEFTQAKQKVREFRRLKQDDIVLDNYNFSTIFVDPPRAGLDDTTRDLAKEFNQIIYISCNPQTLKRDLEILTKTHKIKQFAFFDQFAYTTHIESGVILEKC